jgi:MraZ protein
LPDSPNDPPPKEPPSPAASAGAPGTPPLILGEFQRVLDERYRVSIPVQLIDALALGEGDCVLAKERSGALSLWNANAWQDKLDSGVQLVESKIRAGRLDGRVEDVQRLGRLLSTRHRHVQLAGRGRLLIPEGFRDFLGAPESGELLIVGAAVCVEIWRPSAWIQYIEENMTEFRQLFDSLSG